VLEQRRLGVHYLGIAQTNSDILDAIATSELDSASGVDLAKESGRSGCPSPQEVLWKSVTS